MPLETPPPYVLILSDMVGRCKRSTKYLSDEDCCRSLLVPAVAAAGADHQEENNIQRRSIMFDIERVMKVMSEILSDKYDVKITLTVRKKEEAA